MINLGCEKNLVDGEVLMGFLAERYEVCEDAAEAHVIVVNTCTFIEAAREESIEAILSVAAFKQSGCARLVVVTGCLGQRYCDELLREIPEIDGVFGGEDLRGFVDFLAGLEHERMGVRRERPVFLYDESMPRVRTSPSYLGYVKIADGCDNCCSYCVLPQTKGPFRSRRLESVVEEVRRMAAEGVREVVFLAQDTTLYGSDLYGEPMLAELLRRCCRVEGIVWFRVMYCYPERVSDELIDVMAGEPKICRYMDLPLQHASDPVLAAMNRRYSREQARMLIEKLRARIPGVTLRTTFITGFPGETAADFAVLKDFVREMKFDHVGVFAYSQEEDTPAGRRLDQIEPALREERREEIMLLQAALLAERAPQRVGEVVRVVLETMDKADILQPVDQGAMDNEECRSGAVQSMDPFTPEADVLASDQLEVEQNFAADSPIVKCQLPFVNWIARSEGDAPEVDGCVYVRIRGDYEPGSFVDVRVTGMSGYDLFGEEVACR
ncbi:MAG: 30S ribosomal protein S12 methylthiotransferase RimO [Peptococcaceae bacterium]|nr:30S ribosomal protein S12 methylthiotransferase RimO [Peptococcaceae bacterium]